MTDTPDSIWTLDLGTIFRALQSLRPDPERDLRMELLRRQVEAAGAKPPTPYIPAEWGSLDFSTRKDFAILGARGSGKTATALAIAQASQRTVIGIDFPTDVAASLGIGTAPHSALQRVPSGSCIVLDEARLRVNSWKRDWLWSVVSLARHRDHSLIYTSQSTASLAPDILRMELAIVWKVSDPLAAKFGRDELQEQAATAQQLLKLTEAPMGTAIYDEGSWILTQAPLPQGWSDKTSRLWR